MLYTRLRMWIWLVPSVIGLIYCAKYWDRLFPPIGDVISPLVTLAIAGALFISYPISVVSCLLIGSLISDATADYYMDRFNLIPPLSMFAIGHTIRQSAFLYASYPSGSLSIFFITISFILVLWFVILPMFPEVYETLLLISVYATVVGLTLVNICLSRGQVSLGFILFIISDLIIAYELIVDYIAIRPIRIILVPSLFWLSEFFIITELLG